MRRSILMPIYLRKSRNGGWAGIRTPGAFRHTRFPGVHNRPLCHPSLTPTIYARVCCREAVSFPFVGWHWQRSLQLQPPKQFVERELNADEKFAEVGVIRAYPIEAHFVNDRFNLKSVARKKRHAPFRIVQASRAGDELSDFAGKLAPNRGMSFHQLASFVIRQRVPVSLLAATFPLFKKHKH